MMKLRVHHLFCSALYVGKGYSEDFCRNMDAIVHRLWDEESAAQEIELMIQPDCICRECPNLTKDGCSMDDNHVVSKDMQLAEKLKLELNHRYTVTELLRQVAENMTEEIFETSCRNCEWYQILCRYEQLADKYQTFKAYKT